MTKNQKDKIIKALAEERKDYENRCVKRIVEENGRVIGADYMFQKCADILRAEVESQSESEVDL